MVLVILYVMLLVAELKGNYYAFLTAYDSIVHARGRILTRKVMAKSG